MRRPAVAALLWALGPLAAAQVAPGPNVNPRAVWSNPPEQFTSRVVARRVLACIGGWGDVPAGGRRTNLVVYHAEPGSVR